MKILSFLLFSLISLSSFSQECMIGEVKIFAGNFAPRNWAFAQGQLLSIANNSALFSILGTTYGGDGRTTFALPDLRSRAPIGQGTGTGLSTTQLGEKGGQELATITQMNLPDLFFAIPVNGVVETEDNLVTNPRRDGIKGLKVQNSQTQISISGGNQPLRTRNPFLGVNYIICLQGIYPSRS